MGAYSLMRHRVQSSNGIQSQTHHSAEPTEPKMRTQRSSARNKLPNFKTFYHSKQKEYQKQGLRSSLAGE